LPNCGVRFLPFSPMKDASFPSITYLSFPFFLELAILRNGHGIVCEPSSDTQRQEEHLLSPFLLLSRLLSEISPPFFAKVGRSTERREFSPSPEGLLVRAPSAPGDEMPSPFPPLYGLWSSPLPPFPCVSLGNGYWMSRAEFVVPPDL